MLLDDLKSPAGGQPKRGPGRPSLSNEELLDTALDIFLEKGFERTSIDAITSSAGMAKRTVYMRYGDKGALFKAALHRAIEEWIVPVDTLRAAETDDFAETLIRIGEILVANVVSPAGVRLLRITNAESARMPEISAYTYQQGTQPTLSYLADLLARRAAPLGIELEDANQAALAYLYLVVAGPGSSTAWGVTFDLSTLEAHVRYCVSLFLHGLYGRKSGPAPQQRETAQTALVAEDMAEAGMSTSSQGSHALEQENRRLRKLLVEAMLELAELRERRAD